MLGGTTLPTPRATPAPATSPTLPAPPALAATPPAARPAPFFLYAAIVALGLAATAAANERPSVQFTRGPAQMAAGYYAQQFGWLGADADGSVASYRWAIDPGPIDTFWVDTPDTSRFLLFAAGTPETPFALPGLPEYCSSLHTVVVKAVDDLGLQSPAQARTFVARNQAPAALISSPAPGPSIFAVASTVLIDWAGTDPDGLFSTLPTSFKYRIVSRETIQGALGIALNPTEAQLRQYFLLEAPGFASWDIKSRDSSQVRFTNLNLGQVYYFAVVAFDEAQGWDPRFTLSANLLAMQVTSVSGVPGAGPAELRLAPPSPNPSREGVRFEIALPRGGDARLEVFDASGRRVRVLVSGQQEAGPHTIAWDLTSEAGPRVRPGVYLARFGFGSESRVRRFVVKR